MSGKCSPNKEKKKSEKYGIIITKPNGKIKLSDRQTKAHTKKERKIKRQQCCESPAVEVCTFMRMCVPGRVS